MIRRLNDEKPDLHTNDMQRSFMFTASAAVGPRMAPPLQIPVGVFHDNRGLSDPAGVVIRDMLVDALTTLEPFAGPNWQCRPPKMNLSKEYPLC